MSIFSVPGRLQSKRNRPMSSGFKKIVFLLTLLPVLLKGQEHKYWIYDTSAVTCFWAEDRIVPDTIAFLKSNSDKTAEIGIYWDKEFKHLYCRNMRKDSGVRITYYRNGQVDEKMWYNTVQDRENSKFQWEG
ncbi:MAG TPA: hypothetical protein VNZ86_10515 [Bacteroidia bacterium]|nr:hypothetical protein [Bacteroidia bacterium]